MNLIWLLRAKTWVQNPPSPKRIKLVFGVIGLCLVLFGIEYYWGWPEWLTADNPRRIPR